VGYEKLCEITTRNTTIIHLLNLAVMKKVFSIYKGDKFLQYLMISEIRFLKDICLAKGNVGVNIVEISKAEYKVQFGK